MTTALIGSGSGIIDLVFSKTIDAPNETIAFHYGDFDDAYGDGTVDAAADNGRVYANTDPEDLPTKFGSIGTTTTASGQTTYTWTPPNATRPANVLVVAGGGGGGGGWNGGGGGAGGLRYSSSTAVSQSVTIKVGNGGLGGRGDGAGSGRVPTNGTSSSFGSTTTVGGGAGAQERPSQVAQTGGSGGGGVHSPSVTPGSGTSGEGNSGGLGVSANPNFVGGGGGGAGAVGADATSSAAGDGGTGLFAGVFGETYGEIGWFAGGGGGGHRYATNTNGLGGLGGGGGGGIPLGSSGAAHTGGGGGGSGASLGAQNNGVGGDGGSGVVLVRYIMDNNLIFSNYVVNRGLAVLLDAADTASYSGTGTTWTDISGNGRNGTLQGSVSWVDQGSASYFDFSGANADYINQTAGTSQIYKDICIVFQLEDDDWNYLLANSTTSDRALRIIGSSLRIPGSSGDWTQTGTTYYVNGVATTTAVPLPQNQWHILGGENKNATLLGSAWNYYLGTGYSGRSLNGKIAFLALYTEPLTAAEHIHNYNALKHRFGV